MVQEKYKNWPFKSKNKMRITWESIACPTRRSDIYSLDVMLLKLMVKIIPNYRAVHKLESKAWITCIEIIK